MATSGVSPANHSGQISPPYTPPEEGGAAARVGEVWNLYYTYFPVQGGQAVASPLEFYTTCYLMQQGDLAGAKWHLEHALESWSKVYGTEEHPFFAIALGTLTELMLQQGDLEGAKEHLGRFLASVQAMPGVEGNLPVLSTLAGVGQKAVIHGYWTKNEDHRKDFHAIVRGVYLAIDTTTNFTNEEAHFFASTLTMLGEGAMTKKDSPLAEECLEHALEIWNKMYGVNNLPVSIAFSILTSLGIASQELAKREGYLERALGMLDQCEEKGTMMRRAATLHNLGLLKQEQGDPGKSETYFQRAAVIARTILPPGNLDLQRFEDVLLKP